MIKRILKNLWRNRRNNAWLFAEMILVAVVAWPMVDPVAVTLYRKSLPLGYDIDRLCRAEITNLYPTSFDYDTIAEDTDERKIADLSLLAARFRSMPEVESVSVLTYFAYPESNSASSRNLSVGDKSVYAAFGGYIPGQNYFETLGIGSVEGYAPVEALSRITTGGSEAIITRSLAETLWPGENATGKTYVDGTNSSSPDTTTVVGVVDDFRMSKRNPLNKCVWKSVKFIPHWEPQIYVRLREGVSAEKFAGDVSEKLKTGFRSGNCVVTRVMSYNEFSDRNGMNVADETMRALKLTLLVFFLINLTLGVIGTFMLQTRRRIGEMAVLKVFGANRRNIVAMLTGESLVLTFAGWLVGMALYLQYALRNGLYDLAADVTAVPENWVENFPVHFTVISLIILVLMWVIVTVGTLVPALRISRVAPADALRDE